MKPLILVVTLLAAVFVLGSCNNNTTGHANDDTSQRAENNKELQAIPNDPNSFKTTSTQPLANPQTPVGQQ